MNDNQRLDDEYEIEILEIHSSIERRTSVKFKV